MKRMVLSLLGAVLFMQGLAQQKPHYTQYILNQYIINPALTGIENYVDLKLSHRQQWVGLQDAPVTTYITIHGALNKKDYRTTATSYAVPGENPRGTNYWEQYEAAKPHHGIGMQVINDRTGPLSNFSAYATYAYHLGISARTSLSAGFGAGIRKISLDAGRLDFGSTSPIDPVISSSNELNSIKPDLNAGLYLYSSDYFIGLSAQQIIPQSISFSNNALVKDEGKAVPHLFATAGYRFLVGEQFNLIPSVMVKYVQPVPVQVEVNAKLQYLDRAWIGASYRQNDGLAAMVGLNIGNTVNVGYSYDYTTSRLNTVSKGTHEIVIGLLLGNKYDDSCPRNVW